MALRKVDELKPDVVLMDVNMPQMDGLTATAKLAKSYPNVRVIILSMDTERKYAVDGGPWKTFGSGTSYPWTPNASMRLMPARLARRVIY